MNYAHLDKVSFITRLFVDAKWHFQLSPQAAGMLHDSTDIDKKKAVVRLFNKRYSYMTLSSLYTKLTIFHPNDYLMAFWQGKDSYYRQKSHKPRSTVSPENPCCHYQKNCTVPAL